MALKSSTISFVSAALDIIGVPITALAALVSKIQARLGAKRLPISYKIWDFFGVAPVRYHYYQPIFKIADLNEDIWTKEDPVYGINLNTEAQLNLLKNFNYNDELEKFPINQAKEDSLTFYYDNWMFCSGDAETLYNIIRHFQPEKVIEIGSGFSTRIAKQALNQNRIQGKQCQHICIEPYEAPWLEKLGVDQVIREKVENLPISYFEDLKENDILFIDSSHVLRTGGDVYYEFLRVLPKLKPGVMVHIHDIFIPFEYPRNWLEKERWFWTEQYLLQAFLVFNSDFEVLLGLNYLANHHRQELEQVCPIFAQQKNRVASSFWLRRK
jgi:predicted O-methyltransferase YrrM